MRSVQLSNCLVLDTEKSIVCNVQFQDVFICKELEDKDIVLDCSQYIVLPGLINAASMGIDSVQQGFTTNIVLGHLEHPCAISLEMYGNEYKNQQYHVGIIDDFTFNHLSSSTLVNSLTFPNGDALFGTGSKKYYCNIWRQLQHAALQMDSIQLFKLLTTTAAARLSLEKVGLISTGYYADFILLKSPQKDLKSIFVHGNPEIVAVFKHGQLVHSNTEFEDQFKLASMEYYYKHDNIPMNEPLVLPRFDSIEKAIEEFKKGNFVIAVDNEDRENEGDLLIAGQDFTPEKAAFMIRYTSGVICAPATGQILDRLQLPLMVKDNQDTLKTAYTISVDAKNKTTTGISARDRSTTVQALASESSQACDFNRPGHIFPLRAADDGVLQRVGHTEASIDLCKLAGKAPVAAIAEIVLDNGLMARRDDLIIFAKQHGLCLITIDDLVKYRIKNK